jgi:hypothetical protein
MKISPAKTQSRKEKNHFAVLLCGFAPLRETDLSCKQNERDNR